MSTTIDQKVVEMQFDNKQFESGVSTTMNSLEKLKKSLNFRDSSKELENFSYTVGLSLKDIKNKMWALLEYDIAGKLKNQILNITKALTITPITTGFNEYELKMGSIQTIMASTGESLETVNQYLGELNEYSDKTIYSFQDMTSNIGKFTNAGISLKDSVAAIQGVANVAAISGANANEASRAMYNFSQALSSGYVKLIDWKSIELANMATVDFKNQLLETAVAEGKLTKTSDGMYKTLKGTVISATKNFNDSLQEQWMTSEVLTQTLAKYADETTDIGKKATQAATEVKTLSQLYDTLKESAQSGWAQTWEIIIGDFEEAKKFLAELNDIIGGLIGNSAEARNTLLENWKVLGGRDDIIEAFRNIVEAISSVVKPIKEAWEEIFSPLTSEGLKGFTEGLKNFTKSLVLTDEAASDLKRVFKGIFSVFSIVVEIFKGAAEALGLVGEGADDLGGGLLGVLATIGDILTAIANFIKETKIIRKAFTVIGKTIKVVFTLVGNLLDIFTSVFDSSPLEVFNGVLENLSFMLNSICDSSTSFRDSFLDAIDNLGSALKNSLFFRLISSLLNTIKSLALGIAKTVGGVFKSIGNAFAYGDFKGGFEIINGLLEGGVLVGITAMIKKIIDLLKAPEGFLDTIKGVIEGVTSYFKSMTNAINANALKTIATAVLILTASLIALTFVDPNKLEEALAAITLAFGELLLIFTLMQKIGSKGGAVGSIKDSVGSLSSIIGMMIGLLVVSRVIQKIGELDWATWGKGLLGVTICLTVLAGTQIMLSHLVKGYKKAKDGAKAMRSMAITLLLLAVPLRIIGAMDWASWGRAMIGLTIVLSALVGAQIMMTKLAGSGKKMLQGAGAVAIMAVTINMLVPSLVVLGLLPTNTLIKGTLGFISILAALAGAQIMLTKLAGSGKKMLQGAGAVAIMAATIGMITPSLLILGLMPTKSLIQGALGFISILAALTGAQMMLTKLAGSGKKMLQGSGAVAIMAATILMITPSLLILGSMSTKSLIRGALGFISILAALAGAQIMLTKLAGSGKKMLQGAGAVAIMAATISLIIPPLLVLGLLPWQKLLQGVLGMTAILAAFGGAMIMMTRLTGGGGANMILAATSMVIMAAAINVLTPALIALSLVPLVLLVKSLGAVAAAFVIFALGAKLLAPAAPILLAVGSAVALFGAGIVALGVGLSLAGVGLKLLAVGLIAIVAALGATLGGIVLLIPGIVKAIGQFIVSLCEVVAEAAPKIASAITAVIFALCDILVENAPKIVETILIILESILASLAEHIPNIINNLFDLIVGVMQALVDKLPEFLSAIKMDPDSIQALFKSVMMLGAIMAVAAGFKFLGKQALIGVLYMGLVITELSLVLAAIGALNKIPGLQDFVESGGDLLQAIGTAIGQFIGGLVGGATEGVTSALPQIGQNLSDFMNNASDFIEGIKQVNDSVLSSTGTLIGVILALTAASIVDGLTRWTQIFTGGSSLSSFGDELVAFAPKIKQYADIVSGIDAASVEASANAAQCLSELAHNLPNSGGLLGKILGENDIGAFGDMLVPFGKGLADYSQAVIGINAEAINNSVTAAKGLVQLADVIPNTGGMLSTFTGDNRMDIFGAQLAGFGRGIKNFATEVSGLVDDGSITTAVTAAKSLVSLSNNIPNEGGVAAWFAGENSIAKFANSLPALGRGLKGFTNEVVGVDAVAVEAAAGAAKALAEMTETIPNEGGVAAWFAGENSIVTFSDSLPLLGEGLQGFAAATTGITPETVIAAANAAKVLAEMTETIPNEGGIAAWFSGESSISKFGNDLTSLGKGIKGFADETTGIAPETVNAAANACKALAEMTAAIPNEGGVAAWFSGKSSISKFGTDLVSLGKGIKGFADETTGIAPETVSAASEAAKNLAAMVEVIPNEGGIKSWFAGETSLSKFSNEIPKLGKSLFGFSEAVTGINAESISAAANAAKSLAEMTAVIPKEGGIKAWFSGESGISAFADKLPALGEGLTGFSESVAGINPENVSAAAEAARNLAEMTKTAPKDSSKIVSFGDNLKSFGSKLTEYFENTKTITADSTTAASKALEAIKGIADINFENIKSVAGAIKELTNAIKEMVSNIKTDLKTAGKEAIKAFIGGINDNLSYAEAACKSVLTACVNAMSNKSNSFETAGKDVVQGFADGITKNTYIAEAKAAAMATAAYEAAKEALDVNSPSKIFRELGTSIPEGFAVGIDKLSGTVKQSAIGMSDVAVKSVSDSIAKIANTINTDIDTQPSIRPVVDLSNVESSARMINSLFGYDTSIGVRTNVNAISSMMNKHNQNGANDDVVSAISDLGKRIDKLEHSTYNFNGIDLSGDQAVVDAFTTIIRAARMERRS